MPVTDEEKAAKARDAALQGALTQIEREFGKGTIMRMGDEGAQVRCEVIPTGALALDLALGIGGVPRGRIVEVLVLSQMSLYRPQTTRKCGTSPRIQFKYPHWRISTMKVRASTQ